MLEVKHQYQNIHTFPIDLVHGDIAVFNENFFTDLSNVYLNWQLIGDGKVIDSGRVYPIKANPRDTAHIHLPYHLPDTGYHELFLNCYYKTRQAKDLIAADWEIASDQLHIKGSWPLQTGIEPAGSLHVQITSEEIKISGSQVHIAFNRHDGFVHHYEVNGVDILLSPFSLRPNFWRPPTDNDMGAGLQVKLLNWKRASHHQVLLHTDIDTSVEGLVALHMRYALPDVFAQLQLDYAINGNGEMRVHQHLYADTTKDVPMMFKFGMQMILPASFHIMQWYGRGPEENYWDRKDAAFVGLYTSTVDVQFHPYIRPQETGNKTDVRWVKLRDDAGNGIWISGDSVLNIEARHFLDEDLDEGLQKHNRHAGELKPRHLTALSVDLQQTGVGGVNSWGAWPLPQYRLYYRDYDYQFIIRPAISRTSADAVHH